MNGIVLLGGILPGEFQNDLCTTGVTAQEIGDLDKESDVAGECTLHNEDRIKAYIVDLAV